jgi:hypothetical protein
MHKGICDTNHKLNRYIIIVRTGQSVQYKPENGFIPEIIFNRLKDRGYFKRISR